VIALIPVRDGVLPAGAHECVAECGGRVLVVGSGTPEAAGELSGVATQGWTAEAGTWAPGAWTAALRTWLDTEPVVVLPASPDGRDLAPRLAHAAGRPLYAGAVAAGARRVTVSRWGGQALEDITPAPAFVATLQPGVRGLDGMPTAPSASWEVWPLDLTATAHADARVEL